MQRALSWSLLGVLFFSCGSKFKRLDPEEQDHFTALKVYMSDQEEKLYLKEKTRDARDAWLRAHGHPVVYWDRFYQYDKDVRDLIIAGDVQVGWTQDQVWMAWGQPFERRRLTGRRSARSELFVYRFEMDKNGRVYVWAPKSNETYKAVSFFQTELYIDDSIVTEMNRKDGWQ